MRRPLIFALAVVVGIVISFLFFTLTGDTENQIETQELVPQAKLSFFLNESEAKTETYQGHTISIDYISSNPHQIFITINNAETFIENERGNCETTCGHYWQDQGLNLKIEPVTWVQNEQGETVWSFETWDTSQILFEVEPIPNAKQEVQLEGGDEFVDMEAKQL